MSTNNRTVISMDLVNEIMTGLQNAKPSNPVTLSIRNAVDFVKFDIKDALDRHLTWDDISAEFYQRGIICSSRTLQNYYSKVKPRVGREKAIPFSIHKVKENQQKRTAATLKSGRDDTTPSSDVITTSRLTQGDVISQVKNGVEADINLVEHVLINLVVNAIEAVKEKDEPRISLSGETVGNNRIVLKVADNGLGMPPELMEKIFIPFFSTRKTGSGIGLSLCKQIMLLHQGNINVQSTEGIGSAFILQFAG